MSSSHKASCLCGGVKFEVAGPLRDVVACHCIQCRKQTGTYMSATGCSDEALSMTSADGLTWYESTPGYKRGFCSTCGSTLFWKDEGSDRIAIAAGVFDGPLGVPLKGHIYCDFAGDYYEISGGDYQEPLSDNFSNARPGD